MKYTILWVVMAGVMIGSLLAFANANELTRKSSPEWGTTQPCITAIEDIAETVHETLGAQ